MAENKWAFYFTVILNVGWKGQCFVQFLLSITDTEAVMHGGACCIQWWQGMVGSVLWGKETFVPFPLSLMSTFSHWTSLSRGEGYGKGVGLGSWCTLVPLGSTSLVQSLPRLYFPAHDMPPLASISPGLLEVQQLLSHLLPEHTERCSSTVGSGPQWGR